MRHLRRTHTALTAMLTLAVLAFSGCSDMRRGGNGEKDVPATVSELADALCAAGLQGAKQAPANLPKMRRARIDASTALADEGLRVEIVKITDERTWKAFLGASMLMAGTDGNMFDVMKRQNPDPSASPPAPAPEHVLRVYPAPPFVVLVREEPQDGLVERAFEQVYATDM